MLFGICRILFAGGHRRPDNRANGGATGLQHPGARQPETFGRLDTAAILDWIAQRPRRSAPAANDAEQRHGAELAFYRNLMDEAKALGTASAVERAAA